MPETLLDIQNLRVSFDTAPGKVQAVRGVSFQVMPGEVVGVVGESGCGKSVTAQTILGLLSGPLVSIDSGAILFEGEDLLKKSEAQMRKIRGNEIGIIFQDPMTSLNPTMRIGKQITEAIRCHRSLSAAEARQLAIQTLSAVGIPEPEERLEQYPHQFSGGMRQRVMIAIALVCNPKLLIADEPTTALDVTIQAQILELLKHLKEERGMSILLITHDLGVVAGICDRVVVMYAGQVMEVGSVDDIFYRPQHPYTKALLSAIPRLGTSHQQTLTAIQGSPPSLLHPPNGCPFSARCHWAMDVCSNRTPALQQIQEGHTAACWLQHSYAKKQLEAFLGAKR